MDQHGEPATPIEPLLSGGPRFGAYELVRRLGTGGMAETFVALRRGPGGFEQRVCLKRILPVHAGADVFVKMFLAEARIAARLSHGNIVQVLDFGEVKGAPYLALELIDGLDLRRMLRGIWGRGQTLTSGLIAHLAFELGAALDFAHDADSRGRVRGVVHRDISPANVLVSAAGEIKLADFGIAKAMYETRTPSEGGMKGKIPYMSPEYALRGHCDARSDLFSLGVLLYEAASGRRPFDGRTDIETLENLERGEFVPLRTHLPEIPAELARVIDRCLASTPADRFANAEQLLHALEAVPPPPTARRILADRVQGLRGDGQVTEPGPTRVSEPVPFADTLAVPVTETVASPAERTTGGVADQTTLDLPSLPATRDGSAERMADATRTTPPRSAGTEASRGPHASRPRSSLAAATAVVVGVLAGLLWLLVR